MKPWGRVRNWFVWPVKSGPTSGPFTVSSQVIHAPHGMPPPAQFIIVPLRLVHASSTSPNGVTRIDVVPPRPKRSYASSTGPKASCGVGSVGSGLFSSWLRISQMLPPGAGNAAMPSWRPGRCVPSSRTTGGGGVVASGRVSVSWNDR